MLSYLQGIQRASVKELGSRGNASGKAFLVFADSQEEPSLGVAVPISPKVVITMVSQVTP